MSQILGDCGCGCGCLFARKMLIAWKGWNGWDSLLNSYGASLPTIPCRPTEGPHGGECNIRWLKRTTRNVWDGTLDGVVGPGPDAGSNDTYVERWPRKSPFAEPSLTDQIHTGQFIGDAFIEACQHNNIDQILEWTVLTLTESEYLVRIHFTTIPGGDFTGTRHIILEEPYTIDDIRADLVPVLAAIRHEDFAFIPSGADTGLRVHATYDINDRIIQFPDSETSCSDVHLTPPRMCDLAALESCDDATLSEGIPADVREEFGDGHFFDAGFIYNLNVNHGFNDGCFALVKSVLKFNGPYSTQAIVKAPPLIVNPHDPHGENTCNGAWGAAPADTYAVKTDCGDLLTLEPTAGVVGVTRLRAFSGLKAWWMFNSAFGQFSDIVNGIPFDHPVGVSLVSGGKLNGAVQLESSPALVTMQTALETPLKSVSGKKLNLCFWLRLSNATTLDDFKVRWSFGAGADYLELTLIGGLLTANASAAVSVSKAFDPAQSEWHFIRMFHDGVVGLQVDDQSAVNSVGTHAIATTTNGKIVVTLKTHQINFPITSDVLIDEMCVFRGDFTSATHDFLYNSGVGRTLRFDNGIFPSFV